MSVRLNIQLLYSTICVYFIFCTNSYSQKTTGINNSTPSIKAALDVQSTIGAGNQQGILIPRLPGADTTTLKTGITASEKGLMFFDITNNVYQYWNGSRWMSFGNSIAIDTNNWSLRGNTLVKADTGATGFKYLGTNSAFPLILATDGVQRMRIGRGGNIGINQNPNSNAVTSIKASSTFPQMLRLEQSSSQNSLFEFRETFTNDARLDMFNASGTKTIQLSAGASDSYFFGTGNVGIGTALPNTLLHIASVANNSILTLDAIATKTSGIAFNKGGSTLWSLEAMPNGNFGVGNATFGGYPVIINGSGFMGFAVATPLDALHLGTGKTIRIDAFAGSGKGLVNVNNLGQLGKTDLSGLGTDVLFGDGTFGPLPASPWTTSGVNIYNNNTGSVSIGNTNAVGYKVRISGDGLVLDGNTTGIILTSDASIGNGYANMIYDASTGATGAPTMKYVFQPRNNTNTGTTAFADLTFGKIANQNYGYIAFNTRNAAGTFAERVRVDAEGKVGIGIAAPAYTLDVAGNARISGLGTGIVMATAGVLSVTAGTPATGTGAINKVAFWSTANTLSSNTNFHWDNPNSRLGIGTSTPLFNFSINGGAGNSDIHLINTASGTTNADGLRINFSGNAVNILNYETGNFNLGTSGANIITMTAGKVGIGITTPMNKLDVSGALAIGTGYVGTSAAPTNGLIVQGKVGIATTVPVNTLDISGSVGIGAGYIGSTAPANGLIVQGSVGIGITTPSGTLHVNGTGMVNSVFTSSNVSGTWLSINNSSTGGSWFSILNTGSGNGEGAGKLLFARGTGVGTVYPASIAIDHANGNVGINCTAPKYQLQVVGDIAASGILRASSASVSTTITACSDLRFKKDIIPLNNSLNKILLLNGVSYNWKLNEFPERNFNNRKQIGLIAQELEKIYPELVLTDTDGYKSVDYSKLTPILLEAIKEQQSIINSIKLSNSNQDIQLQQLKTEIEQKDKQLKEQKTLWLKHEEGLEKIKQHLGIEAKR